jgi:hypothetical protein
MVEVVVAEVDTLVMAAHRNNGPEPAAQMAAVREKTRMLLRDSQIKKKK